jgi:hypothetical protein
VADPDALDARVAAALQLHKPKTDAFVLISHPTFGDFRFAIDNDDDRAGAATECVVCACDNTSDYPCPTGVALGVPGEPGTATTVIEALTWWWQAHGLDPEAAAVAAALDAEVGRG